MPKLDRPDGVSLHYEVSGSGPPLLLIAGFMSDNASWGPVLQPLAPHFTLIRPDNRSCGQTTPWDAPCAPRIWAEDALALMDALGHETFHCVGHSLGGFIAWQLAYMAPERIRSLLVAGMGNFVLSRNTSLWNALIALRQSKAPPDAWLRLLFPWLFHTRFFDDPEHVQATLHAALAYPHAQSVEAMKHQMTSLNSVDPAPFAAPPPVPMRALLADEDLLIPPALAQRLAGRDRHPSHQGSRPFHALGPTGGLCRRSACIHAGGRPCMTSTASA